MDIQKPKKLNITWLGKCPKCERTEHIVITIKGSEKYLYDEDEVECWCGQTGVIDSDNMGSAWCEWDEKPRTNLDDFNDYYREKYPEKWAVLPKSNHQACTHYHDCWNAWAIASQEAKAQAVPEWFVLVPKEPTQAMLDSARDWSIKKYGKAVGNDGSSGCYKAMIEAQEPPQP